MAEFFSEQEVNRRKTPYSKILLASRAQDKVRADF
jgi:hypothetical protein